jgi:hypothetical protein
VKVSVVGTDSVAREGETVMVPEPSDDTEIVTLGEEDKAVRVPDEVDFSLVAKLWAPATWGTVTEFAPPPEP